MLSTYLIHFAIILSIVTADTNNPATKMIETPNGKVRGYAEKSRLTGKKYFAFRGIPFGKPPIGDLRFKAPEPADPWKPEIIDGRDYGDDCVCQTEMKLDYVVNKSEDCLFLNVFLPDVKDNKKFGVYFHIHGGGFWEGSNNDALGGPDFLIENDVIVITHNYRVGIFGFLRLFTPEYSGNMGLKDTQLALKWTYENIELFRGDKSTITIGGHSSGAIATHLQMYNAESREYFKRMFCLSGSANYWMNVDGNETLERAYGIAKNMSHPAESVEELIKFLKEVPSEELRIMAEPPYFWNHTELWWPVLPESEDSIRPFITQDINIDIYDTITDLNISALFTFTSTEHLCVYESAELANYTLETYDGHLNIKIPFYEIKKSRESEPYQKALDKLYHFYFDNVTTFHDRELKYIEASSDLRFIYLLETTAKKHASVSKGDTYYWKFAIDSKLNYCKIRQNILLPGACHADDLCYLFWCQSMKNAYKNVFETYLIDKDSKISLQAILTMSKLISNFIKYGDPAFNGYPISGYHPIQGDDMNYLQIANDGLTLGKNPNKDRIEFIGELITEAKQVISTLPNDSEKYSSSQNADLKIDPWFVVSLLFIAIFPIIF